MIKKILLTTMLVGTLMLSGCGAGESTTAGNGTAQTTAAVQVTEAATENETKVESTEAETKEVTKETEAKTETNTEAKTEAGTEAEKETESGTVAGSNGEKVKLSETIIGDSLVDDGYITSDRDVISEALQAAGLTEKEVSKDKILSVSDEERNNSIYYFALSNQESAGVVTSNDGTGLFMTTMLHDGDMLYVAFGTDENYSGEEMEVYCKKGMQVEYWAYATESNGVAILIPIIAGSEENGYYAVIPCLEQVGADVSGMTLPTEPLGNPIDGKAVVEPATASETEDEKEAEKGMGSDDTVKSLENMDGNIVLTIDSVENDEVITTVNCTYKNTFGVDICLIGEELYINGVDCSDKFTTIAIIESGKTVSEELFIDELQLKAGDKLEIIYSVSNDKTLEDLGTMKFEMELAVTE